MHPRNYSCELGSHATRRAERDETKNTLDDGHLTRTTEGKWEFMCIVFILENGRKIAFSALQALCTGPMEGVRRSLCCVAELMREIKWKKRACRVKRDIKMWVSGHTWNPVGRQQQKKKASKWKFSHFSVLASRPRRRASAIFWTLRRTQQHSERYAFFFATAPTWHRQMCIHKSSTVFECRLIYSHAECAALLNCDLFGWIIYTRADFDDDEGSREKMWIRAMFLCFFCVWSDAA